MTNKEIVRSLDQTRKLMELHGENEFKIRGYSNAVFNIERLNEPLEHLSLDELTGLDGIGKSIAEKILELNTSGSLVYLDELLSRTPEGILDLMSIRGLGVKKIKTLWEEKGIDSKQKLKAALENDELMDLKGFGAKTLDNMYKAIMFSIANERKVHWATGEIYANDVIARIQKAFPEVQISFTGELRRQLEVLDQLELVWGSRNFSGLNKLLKSIDHIKFEPKKSGPATWSGIYKGDREVDLVIYLCEETEFVAELMLSTGSPEHLNFEIEGESLKSRLKHSTPDSEKSVYENAGSMYCPPEIREGDWELQAMIDHTIPKLITNEDLKGVIHSHSTYSDGQNSLRQMANACLEQGYEYLGISDHSKSAYFYANGLFEERVQAQQREIDSLNNEFDGFKIFKGIESDILANGDLDYDNATLGTFDFIVASVHSGLSMDKTKATERLLTAIANPFTTILGHMTGRLLLMREGFPVDYEAIIKACAEYNVIIEINAHPHRLDIDWRYVHKALDAGVILSINPDAHSIDGFEHMRYGVLTGRKGGLTADQTLNAWSLERVERFFNDRKRDKK